MDYSKIIDYHREKDADLTIAAQPVDYKDASRFDIIEQQEDMKITNFFKEPDNNPSNLASMGIYVFKTDKLLEELNLYCEKWKLHTRSEEKPPAKFGKYGKASCSIISNGAVVNGKVSHSIISPDDFNEIDISSGNTIKSKIWETTAEENKKKIINI